MDDLLLRSPLLSVVHLSVVHVRMLPLSSWRASALQVHQQRKALHKEHEELFDSEVEKLVELNYINQLPAVTRQRCVSASLIRLYHASALSTS